LLQLGVGQFLSLSLVGPVVSQWPKLCAAWLRAMGFLERRSP
jgi:hypothetical protein